MSKPLELHPYAYPFYFPGNDTGCLLVHGLTGNPGALLWLGEHLNQQGFTVYGPRLAGHGTDVYDLLPIRWQELFYDVLAGYHMLRRSCSQVFVVGLSMGGALTLLFASHVPVDGYVALAAPHEINNPLIPLIPLLKLFRKTLAKGVPPFEEDEFQQYVVAIQKERGEPPVGEGGYDEWALPTVYEVDKMLREMRAGLPNLSAPGLFIHSLADETVPYPNMEKNVMMAGSADKCTVTLNESSHIITMHMERHIVFDEVTMFIKAHTSG